MPYRLFLDRVHCIGCADCPPACRKYFKMLKDGKAAIKTARVQDIQEKVIPKRDLACALRGVKVCPVNVIWIKDTATNRRVRKPP